MSHEGTRGYLRALVSPAQRGMWQASEQVLGSGQCSPEISDAESQPVG
jgi:hypothetical protein